MTGLLSASDLVSVFDAALLWFDKDPDEQLLGYPYEAGWIVLLTRDREVHDLACSIMNEIEQGNMKAVRSSWLSGLPDDWKSRLGLPGGRDPRGTTVLAGSLADFARTRRERPGFLAHLISDPATHTGAAGRPTSRHLVEAEMRRRADAGELASTVSAEGKHLSGWLQDTHPRFPPLKPKSIANSLGGLYRQLKAKIPK
jgi:hypothetical protein